MAILTTDWQQVEGEGGLPAWVQTGLCTREPQTIADLEANAVFRVKFVPLPRSSELVAMRLDGLNGGVIVPQTIDPRVGTMITDCVKVGPCHLQPVAGVQIVGDYAGYEISRYSIRYQQTKLNHGQLQT